MSRFPGSEYRAAAPTPPAQQSLPPRDRSRSPPRFADRRPSAAVAAAAAGPGGFDSRPSGPGPGPLRNPSDAPRGPRSQLDGPSRAGGPPSASGASLGPTSAGGPRSLREAPPLGSLDRGGRPPFRERDYDRRDHVHSPRERSPVRNFNTRDLPPRDLDLSRARRPSRDGPASAGSNFSDNPPFPAASSFRGGFGRGRGRGEYEFRGARGARRALDERDLFRRERERSPPPRYGRDLSRDSREPERRDDRRFERRDDDRWNDWQDRDRELDRPRRDPLPGRNDSRPANDSLTGNAGQHQAPPAPPVNPDRLALLESSGVDPSIRRPSTIQAPQSGRRDLPPETPSYLNGRAETTANRYGSRGSSPPTQAPPVPAFSFSVVPQTAAATAAQASKSTADVKSPPVVEEPAAKVGPTTTTDERHASPPNLSIVAREPPTAPKAHLAGSLLAAPKAPRAALANDATLSSVGRAPGVRSMDGSMSLSGVVRTELSSSGATNIPPSSGPARQSLPHLVQPVTPHLPQGPRADFSVPTGPKAARTSAGQVPLSPRPPLASPKSDTGASLDSARFPRARTPPSAPSGPRQQSYSVSPKAAHSHIPTAPKAARAPPPALRAVSGGPQIQSRPPDRPYGMPPTGPSGSRNQWNQWRRTYNNTYGDKSGPVIPAKRDAAGEEKERFPGTGPLSTRTGGRNSDLDGLNKTMGSSSQAKVQRATHEGEDQMDVDHVRPTRRISHTEPHSVASYVGGNHKKEDNVEKETERNEDGFVSSSEDDELDDDEDTTLFDAKQAREERELRATMVDLSSREFRATTPLESIARLARIDEADLQRLNEREHEMDLDERSTMPNRLVPPAAQSSESDDGPDVQTPRGEHGAHVLVREHPDGIEHIRRVRRRSPELISLPYLVKAEELLPLHETEAFQDNVRLLEDAKPDVLAALEDEIQAELDADDDMDNEFDEYYRQWREECEELDWEQEEQERLERQLSLEPGPEVDAFPAPLSNPATEGRRLHKFSSEYEIEQVLKQSEETARIEQEKLEREAKKVQADMEKEARLPNQDSEDVVARSVLIDTNGFRRPDSLTLSFSYEPPADTFTENEQSVFVAAFKDTPKKWGEIASLLPGRTYRDCIHHYYANKWDGRFRDNRAKKFKGGRRARGGKTRPSRGTALMADLNRSEDIMQTTATSDSGRPKRAAAPTTFGEREIDSKNALMNQSPAKRSANASKDGLSEPGAEKAKRQKPGKPGRKAKGQQLANLAAAPSLSQGKQFVQGALKDDVARAQHLEEASLLASFQAGLHAPANLDSNVVFSQDGYIPPNDDAERMKPLISSAKQGASSYWSVPEQADFVKYIAYFGTDFAAIAAHMGTKTQTMIKNHYTRRLEGEGRADLEELATKANARRERGEDVGPPPTPTPIVKRKYDSAPSNGPRTLAPQADPMDVDEQLPPGAAATQPPLPKHSSPPQFQAKPRFDTSAHSTPIPAHRVVPNPVNTTTTSAGSTVPASSHPHLSQRSFGPGPSFLQDARPESRSGAPTSTHFRYAQESAAPSSLPTSQPGRTLTSAPALSSSFVHRIAQNAQQEQQKAMQLLGERQDRVEQPPHQRPTSVQATRTRSQPLGPPLHGSSERKPAVEERPPSPPRGIFSQHGTPRPPLFGPSATGSLGPNPMALTSRMGYNPTPPKIEMSRPGSVPVLVTAHSSPSGSRAVAPTHPPDPPKRSNLLSLLNNDAEDSNPAPAKRENLPSVSARVVSPAPPTYPSTSTPQPLSSVQPSRRDALFGQSSQPGSHLHRPSYPPPNTTSAQQTPGIKHEPKTSNTSVLQAPTAEWPPRHYLSGTLSSLGQPMRANPSPPPHSNLHSRTPSLTTQPSAPPSMDPRSALGGLSQGAPSQLRHSNPYAPQSHSSQPPPFGQDAREEQNRMHHAHNSSLHTGRPHDMGHPMRFTERFGVTQSQLNPSPLGGGREDMFRPDREERASREYEFEQRDREQRRHAEVLEADRRRDREMQDYERARAALHDHDRKQQKLYQQEQQQQHLSFSRPPPMQPPTFTSPFGQGRPPFGVREQSMLDVEASMMQEHMRIQQDNERRRQQQPQQHPQHQGEMSPREQQQQQQQQQHQHQQQRDPLVGSDPLRRGGRPEDPLFSRRTTPSQAHYGYPPPAARR